MAGKRSSLSEKRQLAEAASGVLERIRADGASAPAPLVPAFEEMRRNLFQPALSRATMARACGLSGSELGRRFLKATGESPTAYFRRCRLEVAEELMERTRLTLRRISRLVGYTTERGFHKAFASWKEEGPRAFRERFELPGAKPLRSERLDVWRRAQAGVLGPEELVEVIGKIFDLYPRLEDRYLDPGPVLDRAYEEWKARRVAAVLERPDVRPGAKRRLVEEVPMRSFALCDHLLAQSSEAEAEAPERSSDLCRYALASLAAWGRESLPSAGERRVRALARWARTSYAAGRSGEAEEAVARMELVLPAVPGLDPAVRLELLEARVVRRKLGFSKALEEARAASRHLGDEAALERLSRF